MMRASRTPDRPRPVGGHPGMSEMSQDRNVSEPSMEEILSSIRRIIADEDKAPPGAATASPAVEDDVLELTTAADDEAEPDAAPAEVPGPAAGAQPAPDPAPARPTADGKDRVASAEPLVSAAAAAASMSAFAKLARPGPAEPPSPSAGITVEALVIQLLRPALKEWLDANLPPLVERIVEQEVQKLARRAEIQ